MHHTHPSPLGLRSATMGCFSGFAIPVSVVALTQAWPAGIARAGFFAWQWTHVAAFGAGAGLKDDLLPDRHSETEPPKSYGNSSFDRYRANLQDRLETVRADFKDFPGRLRVAKNQSGFDRFVDARANA